MFYVKRLVTLFMGLALILLVPTSPAQAAPGTTGKAPASASKLAHAVPVTVTPLTTLFNYTVDFTVNLRGRNMASPTGRFWNNFHSTFVEDPLVDRDIQISVWIDVPSASDRQVGQTVSYALDGTTRGFCWGSFVPNNDQYYFRYKKINDAETVRGAGNVTS